jgi:hypothetical protein
VDGSGGRLLMPSAERPVVDKLEDLRCVCGVKGYEDRWKKDFGGRVVPIEGPVGTSRPVGDVDLAERGLLGVEGVRDFFRTRGLGVGKGDSEI